MASPRPRWRRTRLRSDFRPARQSVSAERVVLVLTRCEKSAAWYNNWLPLRVRRTLPSPEMTMAPDRQGAAGNGLASRARKGEGRSQRPARSARVQAFLFGPMPSAITFDLWHERFSRFAEDLYPGRYSRDYVRTLVSWDSKWSRWHARSAPPLSLTIISTRSCKRW